MASTSLSLSLSLDSSTIDRDWQYQLEDLPNELLTLILGYLPLSDLANARLVCSRLQKLVDEPGCRHLWAKATLQDSCLWLTQENKQLIRRAAENGNVEALIMLAVAHLYSEGVPEGPGKGTYEAQNGIMATEYLILAEQLTGDTPPFSWVLFRPPWAANSMCCKACVCRRMMDHCESNGSASDVTGLHHCIAKVLEFQEEESKETVTDWYRQGSQAGCLHSSLELWRRTHKKQLLSESYKPLRELRALVSQSSSPSALHASRLELCTAYAKGCYGGHSRTQAMGFVRGVFGQAKAVLWERVYKLHENLTHNVRYILLDWIIEVAGMKLFSPQTVHLAINIIDRYLLQRNISRSKLQLLGITALLLAARWTSEFILTVREASWLTEETYQYEDVVRMMGGLVGAFKGEVKKETITDYLDIILELVRVSPTTRNMAYYLSESLLFHARFDRYSASHLAAACLLEARILLGVEYPWPQVMVEATGLEVDDLCRCCLAIYDECLTEKNSIMDHRQVKLESVKARYASDTFGHISKQELMSYEEFKNQFGLHPDSYLQLFTPTPKPPGRKNDKLLSFLSDDCYLTPTTSQLSPVYSTRSSSCSSASCSLKQSDNCSDISGQLNYLSDDSQSPELVNFSPSELDAISSPYSPLQCSSKLLATNAFDSGFPQPLFDDNECTLSSPPRPVSVRGVSSSASSDQMRLGEGSCEFMDTEDTLFAQANKGAITSNTSLEMRVLTTSVADPIPLGTASLQQGSEETPWENSRHTAVDKQILCSTSSTFKMRSTEEPSRQSRRMPLKSVTNTPPSKSMTEGKASGSMRAVKSPLCVSKRRKVKTVARN